MSWWTIRRYLPPQIKQKWLFLLQTLPQENPLDFVSFAFETAQSSTRSLLLMAKPLSNK